LNQKAAVKSVQTSSLARSTKSIALNNGAGKTIHVDFQAVAIQFNYGSSKFGGVGLRASQVDFLLQSDFVKRLSSGAKISGGTHTAGRHNGFVPKTNLSSGGHSVANRSIQFAQRHSLGWNESEGFAGFSVEISGQKDFGWVRLQFTVGANTLINSLTVIDWGYQNNGTAITAGQGIPITAPEPPTADLALLALGAAGITALRRRRRQASA
jgi:MYXO-CTERM domain-containing protein